MLSHLSRSLALIASFSLFTACGGSCGGVETEATGGQGAGGGEPQGGSNTWQPPDAPPIDWQPCPEAQLDSLMCAAVPVPLDWSSPGGRAISVFVRRIAATAPLRGSLWMLEGGPGAPGSWMLDYAGHVHEAHPDLDILIPDHRGTGSSAPLECDPVTDPPSEGCLDALYDDPDLMAHVNATDAAFDVAAIASWTARGDALLLYGRSYGTYWAHRVASVAPSLFTGIVLDSPCDPVEGCPSTHRDRDIDQVGRSYLARCKDDAMCAAHLPEDAVQFAASVIAAADAEACAPAAEAGLTGVRLRYVLARLLSYEDGRGLMPAVLHRYQRCNGDDVLALTTLVDYFEYLDQLTAAVPGLSIPTNYQVSYAEWWDPSFTVAQASAQLDDSIVASGASLRWAQAFSGDVWSRSPIDPALRAWKLGDTKALVLVAGLDNATPSALIADGEATLAPGSHWVELAYAGHVASAGDEAYGACARALVDAFIAEPGGPLDESCVVAADADAEQALFTVSASTALTMLGTANVYGD